jgi:hypothetical protein
MREQADAGKSAVDRQEVMKRAGGCRQEYYEQAGSYEESRRMQARILRTGRKL